MVLGYDLGNGHVNGFSRRSINDETGRLDGSAYSASSGPSSLKDKLINGGIRVAPSNSRFCRIRLRDRSTRARSGQENKLRAEKPVIILSAIRSVARDDVDMQSSAGMLPDI